MNQTQWKNRGWWMSVEINKKPFGKKNHNDALILLETAQERYDLLLESGKTMARGIFTSQADMLGLARVLETVNRWSDTLVYCQGRRLGKRDVSQFTKFLLCAANSNSYQCEKAKKMLDYFGCPRMQIGLMNYSQASLKNGAQFWFSYYKPEKDSVRKFNLDKDKLANSMKVPELCPLFPQNTTAVLDWLPSCVNLDDDFQRQRWVLTKYRFRTRWLSRFPPLVPCSESTYRQWIKNLFVSNG
jgi:hypothetical protein